MFDAVGTVVVILVVLAILAVVAYALFEMSPFASHTDRYRDPETQGVIDSPHLETRDEFEQRERQTV